MLAKPSHPETKRVSLLLVVFHDPPLRLREKLRHVAPLSPQGYEVNDRKGTMPRAFPPHLSQKYRCQEFPIVRCRQQGQLVGRYGATTQRGHLGKADLNNQRKKGKTLMTVM